MGRKDTFNRSKASVFESMLDEPLKTDEIKLAEDKSVPAIADRKTKTTNDKTNKAAIKKEKPVKKTTQPKTENEIGLVKKPVFGVDKKPASVNRSFNIPKEISQILDATVSDGKGGKVKGSYGFIKTVVTNGIIKELIDVGVLDENYKDNLREYD